MQTAATYAPRGSECSYAELVAAGRDIGEVVIGHRAGALGRLSWVPATDASTLIELLRIAVADNAAALPRSAGTGTSLPH